jgi:hypothetical protein
MLNAGKQQIYIQTNGISQDMSHKTSLRELRRQLPASVMIIWIWKVIREFWHWFNQIPR